MAGSREITHKNNLRIFPGPFSLSQIAKPVSKGGDDQIVFGNWDAVDFELEFELIQLSNEPFFLLVTESEFEFRIDFGVL